MHDAPPAPVRRRRVRLRTSAACVGGLLSILTGAPAQAAGEDAAAVVRSAEVVLVTAQRREENVQDIPVAVTAISGGRIGASAVLTANDIARFVPGFTGANGGGRIARPRYFLRGVGVNDPSGNVTSPTGIYVDDVYLSDTAYHTFPLFDLDRVEVLRGPQGTLWGKNTIGGAVHYITRNPEFDVGGSIRGELGSNESRSVQGVLTGPLVTDRVAGRIALSYEDRGAYYRNLFTGDEEGRQQDFAGRAKLLARISDDLDLVFNIHWRDLKDEGSPGYKIGTGPGGADSFGYVPSYGRTPRLGDPISNDADTGAATLTSGGASLTVNWSLPVGDLTAITSYDQIERESRTDGDNSPLPAQLSRSAVASHQFAQEVRLASRGQNRLGWTVGAHFFFEDFNQNNATATLANVAAAPGFSAIRRAFQNTIYDQDTQSLAVFGEASWAFTDRFKVTGGLRWTQEEKAIVLNGVQGVAGVVAFADPATWWRRSGIIGALPVNASQIAETTWEKLTWSLTPQYDLRDNVRVYARVATGFRSGGYNGNVTSQVAVNTVQPEELTAWEVGLKSEWFDDRLTANLSAFVYDYQNIQVNVQGSLAGQSATTLRNAANGDIRGIELELGARPVDPLRVRFNLGVLTTAEYSEFRTLVLVNNVQTTVDASGNQIARAPKVTANLDVEYVLPWGTDREIILGGDVNYRSKVFFNAVTQNDPLQEQDGYALVNLRASLRFIPSDLTVSAYVNNAQDKQYVHNNNVPRNGAYALSFGPPRIWGVSISRAF